jgi:CxxC-x17-CxxC domain-containing protein
MGNFNKGGKSFGGGNDRKRFDGPRFGGNDRGGRDFNTRPEMHSAVCDDCGNKCEVPFRPSGDKPIFCNDCFGGKRDSAPKSFGRDNDRGSRDFGNRPSAPSINPKLIDDLNKQIATMHSKIDSLVALLGKKNDSTSETLKNVVNKAQDMAGDAYKKASKVAGNVMNEVEEEIDEIKNSKAVKNLVKKAKSVVKAVKAEITDVKKPAAKKAAPKPAAKTVAKKVVAKKAAPKKK